MENKGDILVTKEGLEQLKAEYKFLTGKKRSELAKKIKSARELGDISENSEYDTAREEQAFVEGKIMELEDMLKRAVVIDSAKDSGQGIVSLGSKVRVHFGGKKQEFEIVGAPEANPASNKISYASPLGKALLGKKVGDKVKVEAPVGTLTYLILEVV